MTNETVARSYTGLEASLGVVALEGINAVQLIATDLSLKQNTTSVTTVGAKPLNWKQGGNLASALSAAGVEPDLSSSDLFRIGGNVGLSVASVVYASATIDVSRTSLTGVDDPDTAPADTSLNGELLTIKITNGVLDAAFYFSLRPHAGANALAPLWDRLLRDFPSAAQQIAWVREDNIFSEDAPARGSNRRLLIIAPSRGRR